MVELALQALQKLDVVNLLVMAWMFWTFYTRLDAKIEKLSEQISGDIDNLRKDIHELDKRLCRLEGAFASKDFCALKTEPSKQKVE